MNKRRFPFYKVITTVYGTGVQAKAYYCLRRYTKNDKVRESCTDRQVK